MRYFLQIAYDGAAFSGWQAQPGARTVQGTLEAALTTLMRAPTPLAGAGRTDAGVHATGQIVHFDAEGLLPAHFLRSLNGVLPMDVAAQAIWQALPLPDGSLPHARFSALWRSYTYTIVQDKSPLQRHTAWHMHGVKDPGLLPALAQELLRHQDFAAFCKTGGSNQTTRCELHESYWTGLGSPVWRYHVRANRFLRGMVRGLVGAQIEAASGKISEGKFRELIIGRDRRHLPAQAPAHGLCLTGVGYPPQILRPLASDG